MIDFFKLLKHDRRLWWFTHRGLVGYLVIVLAVAYAFSQVQIETHNREIDTYRSRVNSVKDLCENQTETITALRSILDANVVFIKKNGKTPPPLKDQVAFVEMQKDRLVIPDCQARVKAIFPKP